MRDRRVCPRESGSNPFEAAPDRPQISLLLRDPGRHPFAQRLTIALKAKMVTGASSRSTPLSERTWETVVFVMTHCAARDIGATARRDTASDGGLNLQHAVHGCEVVVRRLGRLRDVTPVCRSGPGRKWQECRPPVPEVGPDRNGADRGWTASSGHRNAGPKRAPAKSNGTVIRRVTE